MSLYLDPFASSGCPRTPPSPGPSQRCETNPFCVKRAHGAMEVQIFLAGGGVPEPLLVAAPGDAPSHLEVPERDERDWFATSSILPVRPWECPDGSFSVAWSPPAACNPGLSPRLPGIGCSHPSAFDGAKPPPNNVGRKTGDLILTACPPSSSPAPEVVLH